MSSVDAFLKQMDELKQLGAERTKERKKIEAQKARQALGIDSDTTFNLRLNKGLRDEFEKLCKANHTNMSREVKKFMTLAVEAQKLT